MNSQIKYEDCQAFNESLDADGDVQITKLFSASPSRILFEMDKVIYEQAYNEFLDQRFEELKDIIYEEYPSVIAHHFRLSERGPGAGDPVRKLLHLKDTWEAIIFVLHAIVWGEIRQKQINISGAQIFVSADPGGNPVYDNLNTPRIFSDALKQKLYNIDAIIKYSKAQNLGLKCEAISEDLIKNLLALQDIRNDISHHAAPTKEEAEEELKQVIPLFKEMLPRTEFLRDCRIYRFENYGNACNCEDFKGYSLRSEFETLHFTGRTLMYVLGLTQQQLFASWDNECFSVSPFLHFVPDRQGHESYLSVYKGRRNGEFVYEPVKLRTEQTFPAIQPRFDAEKVEIQNLIQ